MEPENYKPINCRCVWFTYDSKTGTFSEHTPTAEELADAGPPPVDWDEVFWWAMEDAR